MLLAGTPGLDEVSALDDKSEAGIHNHVDEVTDDGLPRAGFFG